MSPPAKFRKLTSADFGDVAVLFAELTGEQVSDEVAPYLRTMEFQGTHMFGAEVERHIVSMATLHLLPNLGGARLRYGLVENVVTLRSFQKRGFARGVMNKIIETAWQAGAYKVMLLTGVETGARGFYQKLGFASESKIGMQIRRIPPRKVEL